MSNGYYFEDLRVGLSESLAKTVTDADVVLYSGVSGDTNPLHVDASYAARAHFGERVAPGMLIASLVSGVLGSRLPGPGTIYLTQSLRFNAPVRIGETVVATLTVRELQPAVSRVLLDTVCRVGDLVVVDGEALVYAPPRPRG